MHTARHLRVRLFSNGQSNASCCRGMRIGIARMLPAAGAPFFLVIIVSAEGSALTYFQPRSDDFFY